MMDFICLLAIFLVSVSISYEDFRKGVIRNKYLFLLSLILLACVALNFSIYTELSQRFLSNFILTLFIILLLWLVGFWPAGDAKLFLIYSLLLPVNLLEFSDYPVMSLLINTFVPIFFFYILFAFVRSGKKLILESFKYAFEPYKIFLFGVVYLGVCWLAVSSLASMGIQTNLFVFVLVLFVIVEFVDRISPFNLEFFYVAVAVIRLILDYKAVYTLSFLTQFFLILGVFLFFRFFILRMTFYINTKEAKISDLKEGMRIAEGIQETTSDNEKSYQKTELVQYDLYSFLKQKNMKFIHNISEDGLSKEDVEKIKELGNAGKFQFDEILIHTQVPFAIFLLIGFLMTVYLNGDFINVLRILLHR